MSRNSLYLALLLVGLGGVAWPAGDSCGGLAAGEFRAAVFEADITIPVGHACMGGGVADAKEIVDPLFAKGFVLLGPAEPIVVVALDWCQCNNDSYDRWRDVLARGRRDDARAGDAGHRAPARRADLRPDGPEAARPARPEGLQLRPAVSTSGRCSGPPRRCGSRSARPPRDPLRASARPRSSGSPRTAAWSTPDGRVHWGRGSSSGDMYGAPEGEIDPWLKTISLWDGDEPVLAWSCYAVHPMSYYGRGGVSADFPGMARSRRQQDDPGVFQIYFTGCAGDTTAGKYNTGRPENRPVLADRLYQAMRAAWKATERQPLDRVDFRVRRAAAAGPRRRPVHRRGHAEDPGRPAGQPLEADQRGAGTELAASASSRVSRWTCPAWTWAAAAAQFLIMPAESFVGYQLTAQQLRPDSFVVVAGFGDGAAGYIPTDQCWKDGYNDDYCWVPPLTEQLMTRAMAEALAAGAERKEK